MINIITTNNKNNVIYMYSVNLTPFNIELINSKLSLEKVATAHLIIHEIASQEKVGTPVLFESLIAKHPELTDELISSTVEAINSDFLNEELTDHFESVIASSYINFTYNEFLREKEARAQLLRENQKSAKSLRETIAASNNNNKSVSAVGYEDRTKCNTDSFSGWLPTKTFLNDNRVFFLDDELINGLQNEFSEKNVRKELDNIFKHLIANKKIAPTTGNVVKYVRGWLSRDSARSGGIDHYLFGRM